MGPPPATSDYTPDRPVLRVEGRLVRPSAYRPSTLVDLDDTVEWWGALAALGALLTVAGILVGLGAGDTVAVVGVLLFLATAVLAGFEQIEAATGIGVAAVVWTAAGISVALGTDPSLSGSLIGLCAVGVAALLTGLRGTFRARARTKLISATGR